MGRRRQAAKDAAGQVPTVSFGDLERGDFNFVYGARVLTRVPQLEQGVKIVSEESGFSSGAVYEGS
jgi:hypothetical protein